MCVFEALALQQFHVKFIVKKRHENKFEIKKKLTTLPLVKLKILLTLSNLAVYISAKSLKMTL